MAKSLDPKFVFETARFHLRQVKFADASIMQAGWTLDPVAAEMLNEATTEWTVAKQQAYFSKHLSGNPTLLLGIYPRDSQQMIGLLILKTKPQDGLFTCSMLIGSKSWRGKRVAGEVSQVLHRLLFDELGYVKAKVNVRPQNKPMLWLLLQQGNWKKEAVLKDHIFDKQTGERSDILVFGMLANEWRNSAHAQTTTFEPFQARHAT
jgi:RimJ/RimL family protein N-acetyltransferase